MNSLRIEKIQERGLRIIYNDYTSSYTELLLSSGTELMYISRLKRLATFVFKSVRNIGPDLTNDMFDVKKLPVELRDNSRINQPKTTTTTFGLNSARYQGAAIWNGMYGFKKFLIRFTEMERPIM